MLRPGSLLSRTLAVLLLLAVGLAAYQLLVLPVAAAYREAAEAIERSQGLLQRYRTLAAQRDELARLVAQQEEMAARSEAYLGGQSDALAAAALQDQVRRAIERAGGELRSTQILPARAAENAAGVRRASLRLQLGVDIEGLETLLYQLEAGEPYLFIDQITIREGRVRRGRADVAPDPTLDVSLEIYGYWRSGAP
jgi:general secretion pathway protein M